MGLKNKLRVTLVGDAEVGKTSLAVKFSQNLFFDYYCPTESVQDFSGQIDTRKGVRNITVLDTASDNEHVRSLSYAYTDVVVVCFDLTCRETLESVESKWIPELNRLCPRVPYVIAGCKRDEMCDGPDGCVCKIGECCDLDEDKLTELLSRTGASAYLDCSALADEHVETIFGVAFECVHQKQKKGAKRLVSSIKKKLSRL